MLRDRIERVCGPVFVSIAQQRMVEGKDVDDINRSSLKVSSP